VFGFKSTCFLTQVLARRALPVETIDELTPRPLRMSITHLLDMCLEVEDVPNRVDGLIQVDHLAQGAGAGRTVAFFVPIRTALGMPVIGTSTEAEERQVDDRRHLIVHLQSPCARRAIS